jgi:hypothetical protein
MDVREFGGVTEFEQAGREIDRKDLLFDDPWAGLAG